MQKSFFPLMCIALLSLSACGREEEVVIKTQKSQNPPLLQIASGAVGGGSLTGTTDMRGRLGSDDPRAGEKKPDTPSSVPIGTIEVQSGSFSRN